MPWQQQQQQPPPQMAGNLNLSLRSRRKLTTTTGILHFVRRQRVAGALAGMLMLLTVVYWQQITYSRSSGRSSGIVVDDGEGTYSDNNLVSSSQVDLAERILDRGSALDSPVMVRSVGSAPAVDTVRTDATVAQTDEETETAQQASPWITYSKQTDERREEPTGLSEVGGLVQVTDDAAQLRYELAEARMRSTLARVKQECQQGQSPASDGVPPPPRDEVVQASVEFDNDATLFLQAQNELGRPPPTVPQPLPMPRFEHVEMGCYSQNTEDGILMDIFAHIGTTNKRAVEICSGVGYENNVANLAVLHSWETIMVDGDTGNIRAMHRFFEQPGHPAVMRMPHMVQAFITAENVNEIIEAEGFEGEIDLFSLDMDGMDLWIWKALTVVRPRVVVVEIQEVWGPYESKSRPYSPDFRHSGIPTMGASIAAFSKVANEKGYRLVGCINKGFNAFYIRDDLGVEAYPEYDPAGCFVHHVGQWANIIKHRKNFARRVGWVDV